jgi:hypothetical protein
MNECVDPIRAVGLGPDELLTVRTDIVIDRTVTAKYRGGKRAVGSIVRGRWRGGGGGGSGSGSSSCEEKGRPTEGLGYEWT